MRFYLGVHRPAWLAAAGVPLFVSDRTLKKRKGLPRALAPWALDSGGFTELDTIGAWVTPAQEYADRARRYRDEIGLMDFASPQDWMCEPRIRAMTGLDVRGHQERTIDSVLELRAVAPDVPWIPVVQGWALGDYLEHVEQYARRGIDLTAEPTVGVGTVCRRQATAEGVAIIRAVAAQGIRPHAFGFKKSGLPRTSDVLASADSMAWSYGARMSPPLPGCTHRNCANCLTYALKWRAELMGPAQGGLFSTVQRQPGLFS